MSAVNNWNEFVSGTDTNDELDQDTVREAIELAADALAEMEAALAERDRMLRLSICDECGVNRSGACSTPAPCDEASSCPPVVDTLADLRARAEDGGGYVRVYSHDCKGELHGDNSSVPYPNRAEEE